MSYTDLQLLRKTIADPERHGYDEVVADGDTSDFQLSHHPVKTSSVIVEVNNQVTANFTIDEDQGLLTMNNKPAAEAVIEVKYDYTVFSDAELTDFLARDGSVDGAAIRCVEILLADASRRFDYSAGQTDIKASQIFDHLKSLLDYLKGKNSGRAGNGQPAVVSRANHSFGYNQRDSDAFIGQESDVTSGDLTRDEI